MSWDNRQQGDDAVTWIESLLVFGVGDWRGEPFRLRGWQRDIIRQVYSTRKGARLYRQVLIGLARGAGKTEIASALAAYELFGAPRLSGGRWVPTRRDPEIAVAAASWDQANRVFAGLRDQLTGGPLESYVDCTEAEIRRLDAPGKAYRLAAVAGTNEGSRPSCTIVDELHAWTGEREKLWHVLLSAGAKRRDSMTIAITTAGVAGDDQLWYRLYRRGMQIRSGELSAEGFLFVWHMAPLDADPDDPASWKLANPGIGDFVDEASVAQQQTLLPEYQRRRYFLNQPTEAAETQWLETGTWEPLAAPREISPTEPVYAAFAGGHNRAASGIVVCTADGYLDVWGLWEPADGKPVSRAEVDASVARLFETYVVVGFYGDSRDWPAEWQSWEALHSCVIDFPDTSARMAPAVTRLYQAILEGAVSHSGDDRLQRHIYNAGAKEAGTAGAILVQLSDSRLIDLAKAAAVAYERASQPEPMLPMVIPLFPEESERGKWEPVW